MIRTQILITEPQKRALEALAQETKLTISEHVRRAIDEYLERKASNVARTPPPHQSP